MYGLMLLLRLMHIVLGALWVGMMAFTVFFLMPAMREAGPGGQPVMAALQRRRLMTVMPLLALATIISGLLLIELVYGGVAPLLTTRVGIAFAAGGAAAIVAFVLGIAVMRPAMLRAASLASTLASAGSDTERAELGATIQRLRSRGTVAAIVVLALLLFSTGAMAVARYL